MIYIADDDFWLIKLICSFFFHFIAILQIPKTKTCVDSKYSKRLYDIIKTEAIFNKTREFNQSLIKAS